MIEGISTTCFAASYAVALALEALRARFPDSLRQLLVRGFATAGLLAHTFYLGSRALAADASPLSSPYDWYLLAGWMLAGLYFYLELYYPRAAIGLFLFPLVLVLIGAAQVADSQPFAPVRASRGWGNIHGASLLLGTVTVTIGFVAGLMYLLQSYRLKHKILPSQGFRLPSLERLALINGRSIAFSAGFIGIGFVSGIVLNVIAHRHHGDQLAWSDPVVLIIGFMFLWLVIAAVFNSTYRPARAGRKVAYLTVTSFVFLVVAMVALLFGPTSHGTTTQRSTDGPSSGVHHPPYSSMRPS